MTRNKDLIRELLLKLECFPLLHEAIPLDGNDPRIFIEGFSADEITYHLALLKQASFIDSPASRAMGWVLFRSLTWQGHEFLDSVRSPDVWKKTKNGAEAAGGFTFDLLKDLAKGFLKKQIEDHTGVKL